MKAIQPQKGADLVIFFKYYFIMLYFDIYINYKLVIKLDRYIE